MIVFTVSPSETIKTITHPNSNTVTDCASITIFPYPIKDEEREERKSVTQREGNPNLSLQISNKEPKKSWKCFLIHYLFS